MAEHFYLPAEGDTVAGRYRVQREIGRGGFGAVFIAEQLEVGRNVALKVLLPQQAFQSSLAERFTLEAMVIKNLVHPNTVRLYDYGTDGGLVFMAMEYLEGRSLSEIIEREAPLSLGRTRHIISQICKSLIEAHAHGIVHRDLKPDNVMLIDIPGESDLVKVLDFGIAKAVAGDLANAPNLTATGQAFGTPRYMAPELLGSKVIGPPADIYAVGLILAECLTSEPVVSADTPAGAMLKQVEPSPHQLPSQVLRCPFGDIVARAVQKDQHVRFPTAQALLEALAACRLENPEASLRFGGAREPSEAFADTMSSVGDIVGSVTGPAAHMGTEEHAEPGLVAPSASTELDPPRSFSSSADQGLVSGGAEEASPVLPTVRAAATTPRWLAVGLVVLGLLVFGAAAVFVLLVLDTDGRQQAAVEEQVESEHEAGGQSTAEAGRVDSTSRTTSKTGATADGPGSGGVPGGLEANVSGAPPSTADQPAADPAAATANGLGPEETGGDGSSVPVALTSVPTGARVVRDGVVLGETPVELSLDPGETVMVQLELEGRVSKAIAIQPRLQQTYHVDLVIDDAALPVEAVSEADAQRIRRRRRVRRRVDRETESQTGATEPQGAMEPADDGKVPTW